MSGSLGEQEMLWEHEPQARVSTAFPSSPKLSREKKENNLLTLIIKLLILFVLAITTSAVRTGSVSPSSYTNTVFNQSAHVLFQSQL